MSKARQLADNGAATPNRNMIINGAMNVAQRGTSTTGIGITSGYFTVDRVKYFHGSGTDTAGRLTMTQTADGPSGFANCLKLACTTADTSIASDEQVILQVNLIEGQNLQRIKKGTSDAEEITVSFYVKGNASATYCCEVFDLDNSRQASKTFAVTTSWNRIELTFPADTTGAYDDDNAASFVLNIWIHAGSNYTSGTLSQTWTSNTAANRAVGISSFFDSTDRTFFLTGVQMEVGSSATPFEHKPFGQDLAESRRYYTTHEFSGQEFVNIEANTATHKFCGFPLPGNMRTTPTVTLPSGMTGGAVSGLTGTVSAVTVTSTQETRCAFRVTMSEATGTARAVHHCDTFDADVATIDAEL